MEGMQFVLVTVLLVGTLVPTSQALLCYDCSIPRKVEGVEQDLTCLKEPWKIVGSVRTCLPHLKACKTVRRDHKETGRISSFVRGCSFPGQDYTETNQNYIINHRFCTTNKCNKGDGKGSDEDGQNNRFVAILVKDAENAGNEVHFSIVLLTLPVFLPLAFAF